MIVGFGAGSDSHRYANTDTGTTPTGPAGFPGENGTSGQKHGIAFWAGTPQPHGGSPLPCMRSAGLFHNTRVIASGVLMAKSDEVFALARAAIERDHDKAVSTVRCIIAGETDRSTLKPRLQRLLENFASRNPKPEDDIRLDNGLDKLVQIQLPSHDLSQVVLSDDARLQVTDLLTEQRYTDALAAYNLHPRNRLLLMGPPGTGKTVLAGAIARALELPFLVVDYGALITSYMGETGAKISKLLDGLAGQPCVLFFDEMETILAERSGNPERSDVGEQARIVSTLLLAMDRMDHRILLVGATNHPDMLDRAVRRRFDLEIEMPLATEDTARALIKTLSARHPGLPFAEWMSALLCEGRPLADLEREMLDRGRKWVIRPELPR